MIGVGIGLTAFILVAATGTASGHHRSHASPCAFRRPPESPRPTRDAPRFASARWSVPKPQGRIVSGAAQQIIQRARRSTLERSVFESRRFHGRSGVPRLMPGQDRRAPWWFEGAVGKQRWRDQGSGRDQHRRNHLSVTLKRCPALHIEVFGSRRGADSECGRHGGTVR